MTLVTDFLKAADTHANRPATATDGALFSCTTHGLVYRYTTAGGWATWAALGGSYADPLTTKGDLTGRSASATVRIPVGSNGQVLTADSTDANGVKWAAASGGTSPFYLSRKTLHSTYGDDFAGTSLNARWTRRTVGSGQETWQAGESGLYVANMGSGHFYTQTAPSGDFTIEADITPWGASTTFIPGLAILDSSGAGIGCGPGGHSQQQFDMVTMAAYAYSTYGAGITVPELLRGQRMWLKLVKTGTSYQGFWSLNGQVYFPQSAPTASTNAFTVASIGVGCIFADAANNDMLISRFNVV